MELELREHTPIANKWLILLSGINENAVDSNGKKVYEQHKFRIPSRWIHPVKGKKKRWSHTMINQIIAYCGLANSNGEIGIVSLSKLSKLIGCSIKSLENNNKLFVALNLIEIEHLIDNSVHIRLVDYHRNFLDLYDHNIKGSFKAAQDPVISNNNEETEYHYSFTGYTTIARESLLDFFKITEVNEARIACRGFYNYEKEVNVSGNKSAFITARDLKGMLPAYFTRKNKLIKAFKNLKSKGLFNSVLLQKDAAIDALKKNQKDKNQKITRYVIEKLKSPFLFSLNMDSSKDSRHIIKEKVNIAVEIINDFTETIEVDAIPDSQIRSLAIEFSTNALSKGIASCIEEYNINSFYCGRNNNLFLDKYYSGPIQFLRERFLNHENKSGGEIF